MQNSGKFDWYNDPELTVWLMDSAPAPKATSGPKFDSQYRFVIQQRTGKVEIKRFVPEWALTIVSNMLAADASVKSYFVIQTHKGSS